MKKIVTQEKQEAEMSLNEESHYVHTINDVVELIVVYGYEKVTKDLSDAMAKKEW